jgi:hypothetical protein
LSRVINTNGAGKDRTQLVRSIVLALREMANQTQADQQTLDMAAYIALALEAIDNSIDKSVEAWEKRGYWIKADRFRMEWLWVRKLGSTMRSAVYKEDWTLIATTSAHIAERLQNIDVPQRHKLGKPWVNAWHRLQKSPPSNIDIQ